MTPPIFKNEAFETHALEYDEWYYKYPEVVVTELKAMRRVYSEEPVNRLLIKTGISIFSGAFEKNNQ
ncbi:MAG: hypothetical protein RI883_850 [Bacteroidota bacterium]|jgi:hypothetical protein